jgi:hypothetical protein
MSGKVLMAVKNLSNNSYPRTDVLTNGSACQRNGNAPTGNGQPGESWHQAFSLFGMRPASRPRYLYATHTDILDNDNAADEKLSSSPQFANPLSAPMRRDILRSDRTSGCPARCIHSSWAGRFGDRPSLVTPPPAICQALSDCARPGHPAVRSDIRMSHS